MNISTHELIQLCLLSKTKSHNVFIKLLCKLKFTAIIIELQLTLSKGFVYFYYFYAKILERDGKFVWVRPSKRLEKDFFKVYTILIFSR